MPKKEERSPALASIKQARAFYKKLHHINKNIDFLTIIFKHPLYKSTNTDTETTDRIIQEYQNSLKTLRQEFDSADDYQSILTKAETLFENTLLKILEAQQICKDNQEKTVPYSEDAPSETGPKFQMPTQPFETDPLELPKILKSDPETQEKIKIIRKHVMATISAANTAPASAILPSYTYARSKTVSTASLPPPQPLNDKTSELLTAFQTAFNSTYKQIERTTPSKNAQSLAPRKEMLYQFDMIKTTDHTFSISIIPPITPENTLVTENTRLELPGIIEKSDYTTYAEYVIKAAEVYKNQTGSSLLILTLGDMEGDAEIITEIYRLNNTRSERFIIQKPNSPQRQSTSGLQS